MALKKYVKMDEAGRIMGFCAYEVDETGQTYYRDADTDEKVPVYPDASYHEVDPAISLVGTPVHQLSRALLNTKTE